MYISTNIFVLGSPVGVNPAVVQQVRAQVQQHLHSLLGKIATAEQKRTTETDPLKRKGYEKELNINSKAKKIIEMRLAILNNPMQQMNGPQQQIPGQPGHGMAVPIQNQLILYNSNRLQFIQTLMNTLNHAAPITDSQMEAMKSAYFGLRNIGALAQSTQIFDVLHEALRVRNAANPIKFDGHGYLSEQVRISHLRQRLLAAQNKGQGLIIATGRSKGSGNSFRLLIENIMSQRGIQNEMLVLDPTRAEAEKKIKPTQISLLLSSLPVNA